MRRLFDTVKGLLSLAMTLGLLIGVPAVLATWSATRFTDVYGVLTDELASDATIVETLLTGGLLLVFWMAWLMLAVAIVTEAAALARGKTARRLPLLPGIQLTAARLVASCALVVSSFGTAVPVAAAPLVPLHTTSAVAAATYAVDDYTVTSTVPVAVAADAVSDGPRYEVVHGDTWWSLAEQFLEDGMRWGDIVEANNGAVMADGTRISSATQTPRTGWHIALPEDAVLPLELEVQTVQPVSAALAAPTEAPSAEVTDRIRVGDTDETWVVEKGDHFWKIADEALTEAWGRAPTDAEIHPFWRELVDLNEGRLLPPEDPNMVYPAQTFLLPEIPFNPQTAIGDDGTDIRVAGEDLPVVAAVPETPPEATVEAPPETPVEQPSDAPVDAAETVDDQVEATAEAAPVEQLPAPPQIPAPPVEAPSVPQPPEMPAGIPIPTGPQVAAVPVPVEEAAPPAVVDEEAAADVDLDDDSSGGFALPAIVVSGLGLAAAGVLLAINRLRARRVGERRPGEAPRFKPPTGLEAELQRSADPDGLADVNRAMRYLGVKLAGRSVTPTIVGLSVEAGRLVVLLDGAYPNAPAPFSVENNQWILDRTAELPDEPGDAVAPLPTLVTIGHTTKAQLLLDLEHAGVLNITGTRTDVEATMITMAVELAASPLADQLEIICVGFGHELASFDRVTVMDDVVDVAERIRAHVDDLAEFMADSDDALTGPAGRINGIAGDAWTPIVVFAPDAPAESALLDLARATEAAGVTALVTADGSATWQMHVKGDHLQIPHISITVQRANLTTEQVSAACALLEDARNPEMMPVVDLVAAIDDAPQPSGGTNGHRRPTGSETVDFWDPTAASGSDDAGRSEIEVVADEPPSWNDVDFWVEILGPVRVTNRSGDELHFERSATPQLLAYLVEHRHGVTLDGATEAMYPNQAPNKSRMYNLASCARKTLGDGPDGQPLLPRALDGMLHVSDRVGSDYERFAELVAYAGTREPEAAVGILREALGLVRGEPFTGRGLDWASMSGAYTNVSLAVDEAARALATIALDSLDRPDEAVWAIQQGLKVSPRSTELHLLRLRAALAREDSGAEPDAVFQHYVTVMEEEDDLPEGASSLDDRIVKLYEAYRRSSPQRWAAEASAS